MPHTHGGASYLACVSLDARLFGRRGAMQRARWWMHGGRVGDVREGGGRRLLRGWAGVCVREHQARTAQRVAA